MSEGDAAPALRLLTIPHRIVSTGGRVEVRAEVRASSAWAGAVTLRAGQQTVSDQRVELSSGETTVVRGWWTAPAHGGVAEVSATAGTAEAHAEVDVADAATPGLPWFTGAWLDPGAIAPAPVGYGFDPVHTADDLTALIDTMATDGIATIIVTYVESSGAFYYPSDIEFFDRDLATNTHGTHLPFDYLATVLDAADRNGQTVWLGLGRGGDTPLLWEFDAPDWAERNDEAVDLGRRVADELWSRYRSHDSLGGWYLTHEMNDLARAGAYYDPLARHLRSLSPSLPVLAAPAGTPIVDRDVLAASEVDVLAYQDAVGAGYVPYEYTWDPARRLAMLDDVYAAYRAAHVGTDKHLWADVEVWEMDGSEGYHGSYAPAWERVAQQIEVAARHVDNLTAYEWSGFMEPAGQRPRRADGRSAQLHASYRAHVEALGVASLRSGASR